jgi:hypothetical protein
MSKSKGIIITYETTLVDFLFVGRSSFRRTGSPASSGSTLTEY